MRSVLLGLVVFVAPLVGAQPLLVASASPSDYSAGVPLETTVSFTFSEPLLDVTQGFGTAPVLVVLPTGSASLGEITQSGDGATVSYDVSLQPDERYVFLLLDAVSADGDRLARPFALNLTTRGSAGSLTFGGEVSDSEGGSVEGAIVALVTGDFQTGAVEIVAMDVIEEAGAAASFALGPAPFGIYTLGAVQLSLLEPEAFTYGLYDPDGDGTPNILFSASGNDVVLAPPDPITAGDRVADAQATAATALSNPRLVGIDPSVVDEEGRARGWLYAFEGDVDRVDVVQVGLFSLPVPSSDDQRGFASLPDPFLDSDVALAATDEAGGTAFRAEQEAMGRTVSVSMSAPPFVTGQGEAEWDVVYAARDDPEGPVLSSASFRVPMEASTDEEAGPRSESVLLVGSNPAREELRLLVSGDGARVATLHVYDLRGRRVLAVHEGAIPEGESTLLVPVDRLPAGTYVVRGTLGRKSVSRVVTVVR